MFALDGSPADLLDGLITITVAVTFTMKNGPQTKGGARKGASLGSKVRDATLGSKVRDANCSALSM